MQSTEGSKYALSRAGTKDLTAITALWYRSFDATIIRELFMGCQSEADLVKLAAKYERETLEDPKDIWIKVSDRNSGELVGAAQWKLHSLHAAAQPRYRSVAAEWLPENLKKQSTHLLDGINAVRVESNPDPFIRAFQLNPWLRCRCANQHQSYMPFLRPQSIVAEESAR